MNIGIMLKSLGNPVAYFPNLAKAIGGVKETIFLCQLLYWHGKQKDKEGWIYKTQAGIYDETGLSRYEQETARKNLKKKEILQEKYEGIPRKLFFKINFEKLQETWERFNHKQLNDDATDNNAEIPHARKGKSHMLEKGNPTCKDDGFPHANTYITTENTQENTAGENNIFAQSCKNTSVPPSASPPDPTPIITLPLNGPIKKYDIIQKQIDQWQEDFPAVDVLQELKKMRAWLDANPTRRKTKRGIKRFIVAWLSKAQDQSHIRTQNLQKIQQLQGKLTKEGAKTYQNIKDWTPGESLFGD